MLDASALGICRYRPRELYYEIRDAWSFVGDLEAVKLAFPQDDYHQTNELDALFAEWGIDIVYSVLPKHMHMLYPQSGRTAELKGALTGYVDDNSIQSMERYIKPFESRKYDIAQRVSMYSPVGGYYARIKGQMANRFEELGRKKRLAFDISSRPEDILHGDRWLELIGDCRFALGCEGGVSVWDPDGIYHDRVRAFLENHPDALFEEVADACFPGEDGRYVFSAISPRLFESAMMGCS